MVPPMRVAILEKKVSWHGNMKQAQPKVVTPPASTVTPITVAASVILPRRPCCFESV